MPNGLTRIEELSLNDFRIVAFDVDGTLCRGSRKPEGIAESIAQMAQILAAKTVRAHVAFISGSPINDLRTKIVDEIIQILQKVTPHASPAFIVYASGGTIKFTHPNENGTIKPHYEESYCPDFCLPEGLIETSKTALTEILKQDNFWGPTLEERRRTQAELTRWQQEEGEKDVHLKVIKDPSGQRVVGLTVAGLPKNLVVLDEAVLESQLIREIPENLILRNEIKARVNTAYNALNNERSTPDDSKNKLLSALNEINKVYQTNLKVEAIYPSLRTRLASALQEIFGSSIQVMEAGYASINLNPAGRRGKIAALNDLFRLTGTSPHEVLYIGDEFQPYGNDHEVGGTGAQLINVGSANPAPELAGQIINLATPELNGPELTLRLNQALLRSAECSFP